MILNTSRNKIFVPCLNKMGLHCCLKMYHPTHELGSNCISQVMEMYNISQLSTSTGLQADEI